MTQKDGQGHACPLDEASLRPGVPTNEPSSHPSTQQIDEILTIRSDQEDSVTLPTLRLDQHPTIPTLCQTYIDGFKQGAPKALQLQRAKDFALALLQHYYPQSQGFTVTPTEPLNIARHGWNFWLAPNDYNPLDKKAKLPTYKGPFDANQHRIHPEHITSYCVLSEQEFYEDSDDESNRIEGNDDLRRDQTSTADAAPSKQRPTVKKLIQHTYLTILLDDLSTFPRWVPDSLQQSNDKLVCNPRHDILRYALGVVARVSNGYGFLLLGPRLEAYTYDWQGEYDPDKFKPPLKVKLPRAMAELEALKAGMEPSPWKKNTKVFEPDPMKHVGAVDLEEDDGLKKVSELFGELVEREVVYQEGFVCDGSRLDWGDHRPDDDVDDNVVMED